MIPLPSPGELKRQIPAGSFPLEARNEVKKILHGTSTRFAILTGPCSIHDPESALDYAQRLRILSARVRDSLFLVMRVFIEKPRSREGWKGLFSDPRLDGSNAMEEGIRSCRLLLQKITELGVPCAVEMLDPLSVFYLDDLIVWGVVGARTCASPPHRLSASGLPFPVGFKNDLLGRIQPAVAGALVAQRPQCHLGIDSDGKICSMQTAGNPYSHIILRGSDLGSNYDPASLELAASTLLASGLAPRLLVDCAHGNSGKSLEAQKTAFFELLDRASTTPVIAGVMLESFLKSGTQPLQDPPSLLEYGRSVTDPCLSWEETEEMILWADASRRGAVQRNERRP